MTRASATEGGAWEKLASLTLPEWRDGIGLDFTEPKLDDQKNRYMFISNKYGGWSRVVLRSIPHGESIRGRLKGIEPSFFFFDELTEADSPDYFLIPMQQLRRPTGAKRQFVAAVNPSDKGTEHWVWKTFAENPAKTLGKEPLIPKGGGRLKNLPDDLAVYHVPLTENIYWTAEEKADYQKTLLIEAQFDPTAEDRLIRGIWTARVAGGGLFSEYYNESLHLKGSLTKGLGLKPLPGFPILIGYDLGQVYSSVTFLQAIPTKKGSVLWIVFDEIDHLGEKILYKNLARSVITRMRFWRELMDCEFAFEHIADESAINQWRPGGEGSYDAWEFEKEYNKCAAEFGGKNIKIKGCPKGAGSVPARVRLVQGKLYQEELLVSATCPNARDTLLYLEADKDDQEKPKRSKYLHKFDSMSYPMFKLEMGGGVTRFLPTGKVAPTIFSCN